MRDVKHTLVANTCLPISETALEERMNSSGKVDAESCQAAEETVEAERFYVTGLVPRSEAFSNGGQKTLNDVAWTSSHLPKRLQALSEEC